MITGADSEGNVRPERSDQGKCLPQTDQEPSLNLLRSAKPKQFGMKPLMCPNLKGLGSDHADFRAAEDRDRRFSAGFHPVVFEIARIIRDALRRSCGPKGGHPCSTTSSVAPASAIASGPILWESGSRITSLTSSHGHPPHLIQEYVRSVEHFGCWLASEHLAIESLTRIAIRSFLRDHLPACRCPRPAPAALRHVRAALNHLRAPPRRTDSATPTHLSPESGRGSARAVS